MHRGKHQAETRPSGPRVVAVSTTNWQVWTRSLKARAPLNPTTEMAQASPNPGPHPSALRLASSRGSWGVAPARASLDRGLGAHETCPVSSNSLDSPRRARWGFISALRQQCFNMPLLSSSNLISRAGTKSFSTFFVL